MTKLRSIVNERHTDYDLVVIGGGINGAGIARDAQGRGLRVLLVEQDDLAQHTSSASTKLIHGGLRYLEHYEFGLVRKALQEREILLRAAPHIMWPQRFVVPHDRTMRPAWMMRAGLFLYDHLARRKLLPASETIRLDAHPAGAALRGAYRKGFVYSDGCVDDARLVVLNALDAHERGATVRTRTRCTGAERFPDRWRVHLLDQRHRRQDVVSTRALINAAGSWVERLLTQELGLPSPHALRLVKGSHIIVRKLFDHPYAYFFQNPDRRIIFATPYERDFTLIGTTDVEYHGDPARVAISDAEVLYLCDMANRYFRQTLAPSDVVSSYSGVRPLLEDEATHAAKVTRDYRLALNTDGAPIMSVFGGKITTYRRLAEEALATLLPTLGIQPHRWTASACLPGGDIPSANFERFLANIRKQYAWLGSETAWRLARTYGTRIHTVLRYAGSVARLGREILPGFFEAELQYLREAEWAHSADDVLWRRTKLGLRTSPAEAQQLAQLLGSA